MPDLPLRQAAALPHFWMLWIIHGTITAYGLLFLNNIGAVSATHCCCIHAVSQSN